MFNVLVDHAQRCEDVSIVTVIIPFAPAAAAFLKASDTGVRVEVIGRAEGVDGSVDVVVAKRITVLFATSSDLHG